MALVNDDKVDLTPLKNRSMLKNQMGAIMKILKLKMSQLDVHDLPRDLRLAIVLLSLVLLDKIFCNTFEVYCYNIHYLLAISSE